MHVFSLPQSPIASNGSLRSKILTGGNSFQKTFDAPGSCSHACSPQPLMQGEILVA